jgi:hypothetical protein
MSVAAHLQAVKGLEVRVFGEPMSFWETKMPVGMLLRSPWAGSHLSDPQGALTLDAYRKEIDGQFGAPNRRFGCSRRPVTPVWSKLNSSATHAMAVSSCST